MRNVALLFIGFLSASLSFGQALGFTTLTFVDATRNNRSIPCEVFYPALSAGENTPALDPASFGLVGFPAISVGHGFVIGATNYSLIAEQLIPYGFIVALVNTETGFAPSHEDFGLDLAFVTHALQLESQNSTSILHNIVHQEREAIIGHSMGGGAAWLAAASDPLIDAIVGLAPAETNPSAIAAAASVNCSALVFSGSEDAVTPSADNHQPIYDGTNSDCKTFVSLVGGSHCGFIDSGTLCDFGEPFGGSLARADQQEAYLTLMTAWLRHFLNAECVEDLYVSYVTSHSFVSADPLAACMLCPNVNDVDSNAVNVFPNPNQGTFSIQWKNELFNTVEIFDAAGKHVLKQLIMQQGFFNETEKLKPGVYWLKLSSEKSISTKRIIVE
jgi:dienelactone hydrolase